MAKLIILRFESDEEAKHFSNNYETDPWRGVRALTIVGMFQTPTKFCDCKFRGDGFYRGDRHGWWLHTACGRPTVMWGENVRAVIFEGKDQLEAPSLNQKLREAAMPDEGPEDHVETCANCQLRDHENCEKPPINRLVCCCGLDLPVPI